MVTSCDNRSKQQIMTELSSLLIGEKMKITNVNDYVGLLEASRQEGESVVVSWQFVVQPGSIDAYARITEGNGLPFDLDADPPEHLTWYWHVRNGIERICGQQVRFITQRDQAQGRENPRK
jgi:hypothetical protein